jgi:nicotinate phosphoribosyltransferase
LAFANGKPRIKLSENVSKITLPHRKQVFRIIDNDDKFIGADVVTIAEEPDADMMYHPTYPLKSLSLAKQIKEPLLYKVMAEGKRVNEPCSIAEIAKYSLGRLEKLPEEYKRFDNPHIYKVGISSRLKTERDRLIDEFKK